MKTRSKYYLGLLILLSALFVFACFSIVYCVLNSKLVDESKSVEHTMGFVYLFLHLIIVAFAIYFAAKAYLIKPSLLPIIMVLDKGEKNTKSYRNSLLFAVIFGILGIFFALNAFRAIDVMSFFSLGLNVALTNVGISVSCVALYLFFYKPENI